MAVSSSSLRRLLYYQCPTGIVLPTKRNLRFRFLRYPKLAEEWITCGVVRRSLNGVDAPIRTTFPRARLFEPTIASGNIPPINIINLIKQGQGYIRRSSVIATITIVG
ncbi:hypothetical protein C8F04DRAFT_1181377 [Mycena alexandri]|uniref:Uncharacterized protein n=1 Tax=Mycena alexandri TaxID=1745969 RepID=A0AAD6T1W8_9AGAR|nr:hypothetical protein C8F04DRAFT_1181377 [Mycena alexandri]